MDATARASAAVKQPVSAVLSNLAAGNGIGLISNVVLTSVPFIRVTPTNDLAETWGVPMFWPNSPALVPQVTPVGQMTWTGSNTLLNLTGRYRFNYKVTSVSLNSFASKVGTRVVACLTNGSIVAAWNTIFAQSYTADALATSVSDDLLLASGSVFTVESIQYSTGSNIAVLTNHVGNTTLVPVSSVSGAGIFTNSTQNNQYLSLGYVAPN